MRERQDRAGWGAKVIDRLAADLREAFPDMKGFSRNLKYRRAFAAAWPDKAIVQEPIARIAWYHNLALLENLNLSKLKEAIVGPYAAIRSVTRLEPGVAPGRLA